MPAGFCTAGVHDPQYRVGQAAAWLASLLYTVPVGYRQTVSSKSELRDLYSDQGREEKSKFRASLKYPQYRIESFSRQANIVNRNPGTSNSIVLRSIVSHAQ
jgi:hypothetical protein